MAYDEISDEECEALFKKYRGKKIICPMCMAKGKLVCKFGYWFCKHYTRECLLSPIEDIREWSKWIKWV